MDNLKFIDLCAGIGGFHYALKKLGMKCVMASDIDKHCKENYEKNFQMKIEDDFTKLDISKIPSFDVLCAGFPCQPFSKAGNQEGFKDDRGNIFFNIANIVEKHKPKYLILENVRNLSSHDKGNTWTTIKNKIKTLGYHTYDDPLILNTLYFGVPQSRERVVILCKRVDLGEMPEKPKLSKSNIDLTNKLSSILEKKPHSRHKINQKMLDTHNIWNEFLKILNSKSIPIPRFPIWTDWWDSNGEGTSITKMKPIDPKLDKEEQEKLKTKYKKEIKDKQKAFLKKYDNWIEKNRKFYNDNKSLLEPWLRKSRENKNWTGAVRKMEWQTGKDNLTMDQVLWSPRGSGVRIKNIDYTPTLVAMASMIPIYGPQKRHLTPRECARLQSFPDTYKIFGENEKNDKYDKIAYKQFGNAVNVKMIEQCAKFLINGECLF